MNHITHLRSKPYQIRDSMRAKALARGDYTTVKRIKNIMRGKNGTKRLNRA